MTAAVTDFTQYTSLRAAANADAQDPKVLREVAGQFEALFVQTLLKNMRDSNLGEPLFGGSEQHNMYVEMLDKQLAVEMTRERGFGLADVLVQQLGGEPAPPKISEEVSVANPVTAPTARLPRSSATPPAAVPPVQPALHATAAEPGWDSPESFVAAIWDHAEKAAKKVGAATEAIVAQAALETGWGEHVMRRADGSSSFNLFGIKSGGNWQGDSVARPTLEYRNGLAHREQAHFRAYEDLAAGFEDYVSFLQSQTRYSEALASEGSGARFASALQEAGYATDPRYANKIQRVIKSDTMQRAVAELKFLPSQPINLQPGSDAGR